jgi:hypothetical protein
MDGFMEPLNEALKNVNPEEKEESQFHFQLYNLVEDRLTLYGYDGKEGVHVHG